LLHHTNLTDGQDIQNWYRSNLVRLPDATLPENSFVQVLIAGEESQDLGMVKGDKLMRCEFPSAFSVKPKNIEQRAAMTAILDPSIPLVVITGKEGTGKNHVSGAAILELLLNRNEYKRVVLTRTTDEVGKSLGLMPGSVSDKFDVHLNSFKFTFSALLKEGASKGYLEALQEKGIISYMPVQFMRGVSFPAGTLIWADEIAGLTPFELRMLCTRLGEGCKLVLTGSLEQIDRKVEAHETGLYKLINHPRIQNSHLVAHINLVQNERSALSTLISEVL
jgi:PhoH-like ATPase